MSKVIGISQIYKDRKATLPKKVCEFLKAGEEDYLVFVLEKDTVIVKKLEQ